MKYNFLTIKILIAVISFCSQILTAQTYELTFQVDMSQQTVSSNGVHVAGDFQQLAGFDTDWDPAATPMEDADNDDIYNVTVSVPAGTYLYKFINGNSWSEQPENPPADCTITDGAGNINRQIILGDANLQLPAVMFDSCNAIVSFSVSMEGVTVNSEGVHVMGNFQESAGMGNDWTPNTIQLFDDNNDNVFETSVQMPTGNYQYVYVNGNTAENAENIPSECTITGENSDLVRFFEAQSGTESLPTYEFGTCNISNTTSNYETYWWNDAVFYEIFVRSFYDSDGDGIGDFQGIIEKLDYLNDGNPNTTDDLGITGIWLMPIMESPSYHGYDATNYYVPDPDYGTMADFEELVQEAHARGIKIILDLVMNHCSNEHPWFTQSANSENNYRDWFVWSDTDPGFNGPWGQDVWHYNNGSYYYGIFWSGMPDLNYSHEPVKTEMFNVAEFWLNKGVDGFRLDAIKYLDEDGSTLEDTPETFQILEEFHVMYKNVNPDAFTVGEVWSNTASILPYVQNDRLDVCFEFDLAGSVLSSVQSGNPSTLSNKIQNVQESYTKLQYATFLTNHDMDRVFSVLGQDEETMKLAASLYLTLPGIPFVYYGEELGMTGTGAHENIRRPMQWSGSSNAGFTTATPWEPIGDNYLTNNVADMQNNGNSLLSHYRDFIHIRNTYPPLRKGYLLETTNNSTNLISFARIYEDEAVLVASNLGASTINPSFSMSISTLPTGKYFVKEIISQTVLDSLTIDENGGFSDWQPAINAMPAQETKLFYITPDATVNIESATKPADEFSIYPNPASQNVHISATSDNISEVNVKIYDIQGKPLIQAKFRGAESNVNVSKLSNGLYFILLQTGAKREIKRLVIER